MHDPDDRPVDGIEDLFADDPSPGPPLENAVVSRLRAEGLLRPPGARTRILRAAAAVVLFAAGWSTGRIFPGAPVADDTGTAWMLMLWEGPDFAPTNAPEAVAEEYAAWAGGVAAGGVTVDGAELAPGRVFTGLPPDAVADTSHRLGGFFRLTGQREEVLALAAAHPHVAHGGWIEVAGIVRR